MKSNKVDGNDLTKDISQHKNMITEFPEKAEELCLELKRNKRKEDLLKEN